MCLISQSALSSVRLFTSDIISPILGIFGGVNFDQFQITINGATIMYGKFITAVINFLIMAFVIFLIVKLVNKVMSLGKKTEPEEAPTTKKCPFCFSDIDIKATKCPHCTGDIIDLTEKTDDKK